MASPTLRLFGPPILSTCVAFASLAGCYAWASSELTQCREDAGLLLDATGYGRDYHASTLGLASAVALATGLGVFLTAAVPGIGRRRWYWTVMYLAPLPIWFFCLGFAIVLLEEEFFP